MSFYVYRPFYLESWISNLFKKIGIMKPCDLDIQMIAEKLDIHLVQSDQKNYSLVQDEIKIININSKQSIFKQREAFFHELCHILRHEGNQLYLPKMFRDLQEWEAKRCTRYAAIPLHMLQYCNWDSPYLVKEMSIMFQISEEISQYRIEQIYRNIYDKQLII